MLSCGNQKIPSWQGKSKGTPHNRQLCIKAFDLAFGRAVAHGCAPVTGAMPAPGLAVAKVDGAREAGGGVVVIDPQSAPS